MISIAIAIDSKTGEKFHCVFDNSTGLPVEAIQRFLNHCRKRRLAPNTVAAYAHRLLDFWRWLRLKALYWALLHKLSLAVQGFLASRNLKKLEKWTF